MMYAFNETYISALEIPSPIRKWFIERYNKEKEKENKKTSTDDTSQPLSSADKRKHMKKKA